MRTSTIASVIFFSFLLCLPYTVQAADMYLILDKTQVTTDGRFNGTVYVSTGGLPINNADATVHFPPDLVSIEGITTAGSIFNIWVEQPSFSATAGTAYFNGGLPTPGYAGQSGQVVKMSFKAKKAGSATFSFGSPAIRANDGSGTNVIAQSRGATITIADKTTAPPPVQHEETPAPPPRTLVGTPHAPIITSIDMPDPQAWYNLKKSAFAWGLPSDVTTVQLVLSQSPNTVPTISYEPPIKNKTLDNLTDGVLYLNGRFKNSVGWSPITSRKIKTDLTGPAFTSIKTSATDDQLPVIIVTADDSLSGVRSFDVINGGEKTLETPAEKNKATQITLPPFTEGPHTLTLRAYDNAGNETETSVTVNAPEQKAPKISHYPEFIKIGSKIEIRGKSPYATGEVLVWIQMSGEEPKSYTVKPDEDKIFSYTSNTIKSAGDVIIWAQTLRAPGVMSGPSEKIYVSVKESDIMWLGIRTIEILSLLISILLLFALFIILSLWTTRKVRELKRRIRNDLLHTEEDIHKVFTMLAEDTKHRIKLLEKARSERKLTKEEDKILTELSHDLEDAEKYLMKNIHNIEERDL